MGAAWTTLICYAFMMIICYLIGQKYYPVPYDLFRFFGYIGIALGLWGVSILVKTFTGLSGTPFMMFNTLLLLIFPALAWLFERRKNSTFAG